MKAIAVDGGPPIGEHESTTNSFNKPMKVTASSTSILIERPNGLSPYDIELDRCDTPEKILAWVDHLTEKTWMTNDMFSEFIGVACKQIGYEIVLP